MDEIVAFLKTVIKEDPDFVNVVDEAYVKNYLLQLYQQGLLNVQIYRDDSEEIKGIYLGAHVSPWYCPELELNDLIFYVAEEYRGSTVGLTLLKNAEKEAKSRGCVTSLMGVNLNINQAHVGKFLEKVGYTCVGSNYKRTL